MYLLLRKIRHRLYLYHPLFLSLLLHNSYIYIFVYLFFTPWTHCYPQNLYIFICTVFFVWTLLCLYRKTPAISSTIQQKQNTFINISSNHQMYSVIIEYISLEFSIVLYIYNNPITLISTPLFINNITHLMHLSSSFMCLSFIPLIILFLSHPPSYSNFANTFYFFIFSYIYNPHTDMHKTPLFFISLQHTLLNVYHQTTLKSPCFNVTSTQLLWYIYPYVICVFKFMILIIFNLIGSF